MRTAIVWFRDDLRLADHPALAAALAAGGRVLPVYVYAPDDAGPWPPGAASRWWLHHSLVALDGALRRRGSGLVVLTGPAAIALPALAARAGAESVYFNRRYLPAPAALDRALVPQLEAAGLRVRDYPGDLLFEPGSLLNRTGAAFRVFTPFWRACRARLDAIPPPQPAPRSGFSATPEHGVPIDGLGLLPRVRWDAGLAARFEAGEQAGQARLARFLAEAVADYPEARDRPDRSGTSRLSPHLHFGELSPRQLLAAARAAAGADSARERGVDAFLRELLWREFAYHVLHHFPHTTDAPLDRRFDAHEWRRDPEALAAWQQGRTGVPLVDAGMRELWHTGWMHNRVRMVVASFLCKNLGIDWREGARWFHDTLVDADLANNSLNWQWVAGCGADAAPYYRIFNPVLQAERVDPERTYLRAWLPELERLPDRWLPAPAAAPPAVLAAAGVDIGGNYPAPIVDLALSRARALERWSRVRATRRP